MAALDDAVVEFGSLGQLALQIPELRQKLNDAIAHHWDTTKFTAEIQQTAWWRQHGSQIRQRAIQKATDPASYNQDFSTARNRVMQMASQMGLTLDPHTRDIAANNLLNLSWSDVDLHNFVGGHGRPLRSDLPTGEYSQVQDKIKQAAAQYGIRVGDGYVNGAVRAVLSGHYTVETYVSQFRKSAKSAFPSLAREIDAGLTVDQIAEPYKQTMAQTLEISPDSVNLFTPQIRQALAAKNKDGSPGTENLWQFETNLKNDPRWQYTKNAHDSAFQFLHQVGQLFGKVAT